MLLDAAPTLNKVSLISLVCFLGENKMIIKSYSNLSIH